MRRLSSGASVASMDTFHTAYTTPTLPSQMFAPPPPPVDILTIPNAVEVVNNSSIILGYISTFEPNVYQLAPSQYVHLPLGSRIVYGESLSIPFVQEGKYRIVESNSTRRVIVQRLDVNNTYSINSHPVRIVNDTGDVPLQVSCMVTGARAIQFVLEPKSCHIILPLNCYLVWGAVNIPMIEDGDYKVVRYDNEIKVQKRDSGGTLVDSHPVRITNSTRDIAFHYTTRHGQVAQLPPGYRVYLPIATFLQYGAITVPMMEDGEYRIVPSGKDSQDMKFMKVDLNGGLSIDSHPVRVANESLRAIQYSTTEDQTTTLPINKIVFLPVGGFLVWDATTIPMIEEGEFRVVNGNRRDQDLEILKLNNGGFSLKSHPIRVSNGTSDMWTVKSPVVHGRAMQRFALPPKSEVLLPPGMSLYCDNVTIPLIEKGDYRISKSASNGSLRERDCFKILKLRRSQYRIDSHPIRVENTLQDIPVRFVGGAGQIALTPLAPGQTVLLPLGGYIIWGVVSVPMLESGEYKLVKAEDGTGLTLLKSSGGKSNTTLTPKDSSSSFYISSSSSVVSMSSSTKNKKAKEISAAKEIQWVKYVTFHDTSKSLESISTTFSIDEETFLCANLAGIIYDTHKSSQERIMVGIHSFTLNNTIMNGESYSVSGSLDNGSYASATGASACLVSTSNMRWVLWQHELATTEMPTFYLVFRGPHMSSCTYDFLDWVSNISSMIPMFMTNQPHYHYGFHSGLYAVLMNNFQAILSSLPPLPNIKLIITGHGLGGALAQAFFCYAKYHCASDVALLSTCLASLANWRCVTFAAPQFLYFEASDDDKVPMLADCASQVSNYHFKSDLAPMLPRMLHKDSFIRTIRDFVSASVNDGLVYKVFFHLEELILGLQEELDSDSLSFTQHYLPIGLTYLLDGTDEDLLCWRHGEFHSSWISSESVVFHSMYSILKALASRLS